MRQVDYLQGSHQDARSTKRKKIHLYLYLCVCAYVYAHTKLFICLCNTEQLEAKCIAPYVSGISRFRTRFRLIKLFSPVNIFIVILLTPVFGNCAAFLCGRFQELHHCCGKTTSRSFFSPAEWHALNCLVPFILNLLEPELFFKI